MPYLLKQRAHVVMQSAYCCRSPVRHCCLAFVHTSTLQVTASCRKGRVLALRNRAAAACIHLYYMLLVYEDLVIFQHAQSYTEYYCSQLQRHASTVGYM
jgi:hypothetical protein